MPDRSDDYQLPSWPKTNISRELWNAVFGDIAVRLKAREGLEASFELLQEQGIQAALDYIQVSVAPQLSSLQDAISSAQTVIDEILQGNAPNAEKLGGQLPGYYATAEALSDGLAASAQALSSGLAAYSQYLELALGGDPEFAVTMAAALADRYTKSQVDALLSGIDPWAIQPVGSFISLDDGTEGVSAPPKDKGYRYVELTAGLTGAGGYNEGILTSETVSGSSPSINATAVVSLVQSPFHARTIRLINTERRFLRPGSAGTLQDDAMQGHRHNQRSNNAPAFQGGTQYSAADGTNLMNAGVTGDPITDNTNGSPRTANENRPRNIGVRVYRRIR